MYFHLIFTLTGSVSREQVDSTQLSFAVLLLYIYIFFFCLYNLIFLMQLLFAAQIINFLNFPKVVFFCL